MHNTSIESDRTRSALVISLKGAVIASCQAGPESPLNQPAIIAALAGSAALGGARGFRVDGPANVTAVRAISGLPIFGINKVDREGFDVRITPTLEDALEVVRAGATIVALDGPSGRGLAVRRSSRSLRDCMPSGYRLWQTSQQNAKLSRRSVPEQIWWRLRLPAIPRTPTS